MQRINQLRKILQTLQDQPEKQIPYLQEAAHLGDYESIRTLIHCYTLGDYGLQPDERQAFEYTLLGAELGEGWCQYNAAVCCQEGRGCDRDPEQAARWMKLAAAADVPEAWLPCARMLMQKTDGSDEAFHLIFRAIENGQKESGEKLLGHLCSERGSALLEENHHQEAEKLLKLGASVQDPDCLVTLAYEYSIPDGVGQDLEKTFSCSLKAADLGHPAGMYNVSMCYREGVGTRRDVREAFEWMKNAAKCGFEEAALPLAQHYHTGLGVRADDEQALYWVKKAVRTETDPGRKAMACHLLDRLNSGPAEPVT